MWMDWTGDDERAVWRKRGTPGRLASLLSSHGTTAIGRAVHDWRRHARGEAGGGWLEAGEGERYSAVLSLV